MAVRCMACGRLSRDEGRCEWCQEEIPPTAGPLAATGAVEAKEEGTGGEALAGVPPSAPGRVAAEAPAVGEEVRRPWEEESAASGSVEAVEERAEWHWDKDTRAILVLIALQFGLTLYLGQLSSWWSVTGFLWLAVGYGVAQRLAWALALPLVLFTLDVALLLFGIGPRERAGFLMLSPLDFLLYLLRLVIWALIWRIQDQLD